MSHRITARDSRAHRYLGKETEMDRLHTHTPLRADSAILITLSNLLGARLEFNKSVPLGAVQ